MISDRNTTATDQTGYPRVRAFTIDERPLGDGSREVRLQGELDLAVADRLKARLDAAASDDVEVLICLEDCDFIDSTGIAVIILAHQLMERRGRRLSVCHPSAEVRRILDLAGLTKEGIVLEATAAPAAAA